MNIGIFDSGIGGATVLKEILKILPNENYIYYSDSKNNPYGDKSKEELVKICESIMDYLISKDCKVIVIACNTASTQAKYLREKYKDIKILAIEPAYKMVHDYAFDKKTLVMATKSTLESEKFNNLYTKYNNNNTILLPCVGLADIIENGTNEDIDKYIEDNLSQYKGVENIVLGCTHYPLIKDNLRKVLGDVSFFDGAPYLAKHLKNTIKSIEQKKTSGTITFIDSSNSKEKEERFYKVLNDTI